MGQDGQRDMVCASLLGVLFCICLAAVFAGDAGCGMDRLIFTTAGGRRDTFRTVLVSAIVFVLPALVGLLGIDAVNYISLVPLLTGSGILNGFLEGSRILYGILYLLAAAGIIGFSGWYLGRQMRETC